jgi:glyoxylase-like metal-dependent hydrolase (beta-lactamase superfamily II)
MTVNGGVGEPVRLDDGLWQIDLGFQGMPEVIAAYLLAGNGELALIETGPSSTLPALRAGITSAGFAVADLTAMLVTHIHLDHSGAAGVLLDEAPGAQVFVHPIGAPHLIDPTRLVASATRIYAERMEPLWGEVRGIPQERVVALDDNQPVSVAGRVLAALHTPGHASHHLTFWDAAAGRAFTGDVGGIHIPGTEYACPPTPPPDLDPVAWRTSISRLQTLGARQLCLTHFGTVDDPAGHLAALADELEVFLRMGVEMVERGDDQGTMTAEIHARMAEMIGDVPPEKLERLEWATPSYMAAMGLTRWVTKTRGTALMG